MNTHATSEIPAARRSAHCPRAAAVLAARGTILLSGVATAVILVPTEREISGTIAGLLWFVAVAGAALSVLGGILVMRSWRSEPNGSERS